MRAAALVVVLGATLGTAVADPPEPGPPSKTLERAIKLYDRKDFYSASIELQKVIQGDSGDDLPNKQRAEFFLAKTYFQLAYYGAADAELAKIAQDPSNTYRIATLKWLAALARVEPVYAAGLAEFTPAELDDPTTHEVVDELRYLRGRMALRRADRAVGLKALDAVDRASPFYPRARVAIAAEDVRAGDLAAALKVLADVPAHSDASDQATMLTAGIQHAQKHDDDALATYAKVGGALTKRAAWQASIVRLEKAGTALGPLDHYALGMVLDPEAVDSDLLDTAIAFDACGKAASTDALADARKAAATAARDLRAFAALDPDNPAPMIALATGKGTSRLSSRVQALVKTALATLEVQRAVAYEIELDHELAALNKADKAWQTTQAAAEILMTLTVFQSVAQADAAKIIRERLEAVAVALDAIGASTVKLPTGKGGVAPSCP